MNEEKDRFQEADRLLEAALDLPAAEREAYLDRECAPRRRSRHSTRP
jgi:hypothetical protein